MNVSAKTYLGDGVYVHVDNADVPQAYVVLTTTDGISTTNVIYLEPQVLNAFLRWVLEREGRAEKPRRPPPRKAK